VAKPVGSRPNHPSFTIERISWREVSLGAIALKNDRRMRLTMGIGSGLALRKGDPDGTVWAIADRGPNLKVEIAIERYGLTHLQRLAKLDGAKLMPRPEIGPTLCELKLKDNTMTRVRQLPLRQRSGKAISGLPALSGNGMEPAFDLQGKALGVDPSGADTEGLVALSDGTFWIADEFGPSLLHVGADGEVLARWVPKGIEKALKKADYAIKAVLPAIAARRRLNRGFEALALSPDERWLYLIFQSPLAYPDIAAFKKARHVRVWKLDMVSGAIEAQFLYPLDKPKSFARDAAKGDVDRSDIKVSEAVAIGSDQLLVLERISHTTKIYRVALAAGRALPEQHLNARVRPTLEQLSAEDDMPDAIPVLPKALVMSSDEALDLPPDLEGMIVLSPTELLLVNDNDFSVEGARTQFWRVKLKKKLF
jgi:hypothetical protein